MYVKLPAHRAGLPGKVLSFHIVPPVVGSNRLAPAYKAGLAGHLPVKEVFVYGTTNPEKTFSHSPGDNTRGNFAR
jgi:hypothetical protein